MLFARAKPKDQLCKHIELILLHGTIGTTDGVEFSTTSRRAAVTNSGGGGACGKGFREENAALMEEEVFVGDVIPQIANDPGFDGVGCCVPFVGGGGKHIEAAWMREAEFRLLDFFRSCVSGRSGDCVEQEEGGTTVSASVG